MEDRLELATVQMTPPPGFASVVEVGVLAAFRIAESGFLAVEVNEDAHGFI